MKFLNEMLEEYAIKLAKVVEAKSLKQHKALTEQGMEKIMIAKTNEGVNDSIFCKTERRL